MFFFGFFTLLLSADASLPTCPSYTGMPSTGPGYGGTCSANVDASYDPTVGCVPSSDCGLNYCCLTCNPSGSNTTSNVCMLPPQEGGSTTVQCTPNGGSSNWFGCPCTSYTQCAPYFNCGNVSCSPSQSDCWNTSVVTIPYFSGQSAYTQNVCWSVTMSSSLFTTQFPSAPLFPICASTADCRTVDSVSSTFNPNQALTYGPFYCDSSSSSLSCSNHSSCDPVLRVCQSRQASPGENLTAVQKSWWYNQGWCASC